MAITLSDVVVAACNTAAGLSYHSDPDEAPAFGRTFLELVSDNPEEIRQYHDVVIEVRDVRAGSCLAWALDQAKKGALADVQSRMLLYTGAMYGLLGDSAPRRYWPEHLEVPIALDRDVWAETLYWAYAVANDERRVVEWQLCRMCGVACFIEMDRRLENHPTSRDVFGVSHYADPDALKRLLRDAERRARNIPPISRIPHDEVESVLNVSLAQLIDDKVHPSIQPAGWQ